MTAYSAMSCPSSAHNCVKTLAISDLSIGIEGRGSWGVDRRRVRFLNAPAFYYNPELD
jgi:hypothetical protein